MRLSELRYKEIINVSNGHRLGFVSDAELDPATGQLSALIVPGPARFFGLLGREDDYILPFGQISRVGEDIILVDIGEAYSRAGKAKKPLL